MGTFAALVAWVGWLAICPALGFPALATAGMLNRLFVPKEDPGFWLGWALLLIGLAAAALLYVAAADRGRLRPTIASGAIYGAVCWLVAGAVVMPVLGLAVPTPAAAAPGALVPPDPMHGSFMMLHLGFAAPIAALIAWLLFGTVLGATSAASQSTPRSLRPLVFGAALSIATVLAIVFVVPRLSGTEADASPTATRTLATGPVQALPPGSAFISIVELPQAPGSELGPHAHVAGFAYSLHGVETIHFADGQTIRIGSGEAGFMGTQAAHSHLNADNLVAAGALALLIILLAAAVCWLSLSRPARRDGRVLSVVLVLLITAGALGTWNPWSNDWLFLSIRPAAARGAPMPIPTASRTYESPDLGALAPGPYVETLDEITIATGAASADVGSAGPAAIFVLDGRVELRPAGGSPIQITTRGATLVQTAGPAQFVNVGDRPAHLLKFALTPAPPG